MHPRRFRVRPRGTGAGPDARGRTSRQTQGRSTGESRPPASPPSHIVLLVRCGTHRSSVCREHMRENGQHIGHERGTRTPNRPVGPIIHTKKHESHGQAVDIFHDRDDPPSQRRPVPGPPRGITREGGPKSYPDPPVPRRYPDRGAKSTTEQHGTKHHAADSQYDKVSYEPLSSREVECLVFFGQWAEWSWGRYWIVSASKYSSEFTGRVVPGVVRKSRPIRVRPPDRTGSWRRRPGCRVAKWRGEHPGPGTDGATAEEHAGIRRLEAEPREARMENGPPEENGGGPRPPPEPRASAGHRRIHREEGDHPIRPGVPAGGSIRARPLRPAEPAQALDGPAKRRPDGRHRPVLRRARTGLRLPPDPRRAGPKRDRGLTRHGPQNHGRRESCRLTSPGNEPGRPPLRQTFRAGPAGCAGTSPPPRPE